MLIVFDKEKYGLHCEHLQLSKSRIKTKKKACAKIQSITVVKTSCRINTQQIIKAEKSGAKAGKVMY